MRLSNKYGVNPSISQCFFCHGDKAIILMGRIPGDKEAPRRCIVDYEPCEACKDKFKKGFLIIETRPDRTFTGNYWLIETKAAIETFGLENVTQGRVLISEQDARVIGLYNE